MLLDQNENSWVYVTKEEYIHELKDELHTSNSIGNLVLATPDAKVCFALDVWLNPIITQFSSISEAVRILRQAGKFWFLNPIENFRRSHLITQELRKLPDLTQDFPVRDPLPPIGCFSLLDKNTLIYSSSRWKNPPLGEFRFVEDKMNPPNRAYLKLWEALTLLGRYPQPNESAIDLGASPGGWTYVMQTFGTHVTAIDKAPLDSRISKLPRVTLEKQSAFALDPQSLPSKIDWLLCDVACYPERLYDLVTKWIEADKAKQMIFTIKLQGETNLNIIKKFQEIPNARVIHLYHNKHEATFFYPASPTLIPDN